MKSSFVVIAIDGPSASGKSTVSRFVAGELGFFHVDTGSMYRALAWKILEDGLNPDEENSMVEWLKHLRWKCDFPREKKDPSRMRIRINGVDPGEAIRAPRVEKLVSQVAAIPRVREWMVQKQRSLMPLGNLVVEGRDIGTVVFPQTSFKFYLDADPEVRARRRAADQGVDGKNDGIMEVGRAMAERDHRDSTRAVAPLKVASDAVRIDTSAYDARGVADLILKHVRAKQGEGG